MTFKFAALGATGFIGSPYRREIRAWVALVDVEDQLAQDGKVVN
jgi:hypothetical protein